MPRPEEVERVQKGEPPSTPPARRVPLQALAFVYVAR